MVIPGQNRGRPPKTPVERAPGRAIPPFHGHEGDEGDTVKLSGDSKKGEFVMSGGGKPTPGGSIENEEDR